MLASNRMLCVLLVAFAMACVSVNAYTPVQEIQTRNSFLPFSVTFEGIEEDTAESERLFKYTVAVGADTTGLDKWILGTDCQVGWVNTRSDTIENTEHFVGVTGQLVNRFIHAGEQQLFIIAIPLNKNDFIGTGYQEWAASDGTEFTSGVIQGPVCAENAVDTPLNKGYLVSFVRSEFAEADYQTKFTYHVQTVAGRALQKLAIQIPSSACTVTGLATASPANDVGNSMVTFAKNDGPLVEASSEIFLELTFMGNTASTEVLYWTTDEDGKAYSAYIRAADCQLHAAPVCEPGDYEGLTFECRNGKTKVPLAGSGSLNVAQYAWAVDGEKSVYPLNSPNPVLNIDFLSAANCNEQTTVALDVFGHGGNFRSCSAVVQTGDSQDPQIVGLYVNPHIEVQCDDIPVAQVVTGSDACKQGTLEVEYTEDPLVGAEGATLGTLLYELVRRWRVVDDCGNDDERVQTISVMDKTPPILVGVAKPTTTSCDAIPPPCVVAAYDDCQDHIIPGDDEPLGVEAVTYFEETLVHGVPAAISGFVCGNYTLRRTWTASDAAGNKVEQSQLIEVTDTKGPQLSGLPADGMVVECDQVPSAPDVEAFDNCDPDVSVSLEESATPGSCEDAQTLWRTWSATDKCGQSSTSQRFVRVVDTKPPVFKGDFESDGVVECDAVPEPCVVTATDNCDADIQNLQITPTSNHIPSQKCEHEYKLTYIWALSDRCGNAQEKRQTLEVVDTSPPRFVGLPPAYLQETECDAIPTYSMVAVDNCATDVPVTFTEQQGPPKPGDADNLMHYIYREWYAADDCGNSVDYSQTIEVFDSQPPELSGLPFGDALHVQCVIVDEPNIVPLDNCPCDSMVSPIQKEIIDQDPDCPHKYTEIRKWEVSDCSGHYTSGYQTIHFDDTGMPRLLGIPHDRWIEGNSADDVPESNPEIKVKDACDNDISLEESIVTETPNCAEGDNVIFRQIKTWRAEDQCDNEITRSQTINIKDTIAPCDPESADATKSYCFPPQINCDCKFDPAAENCEDWIPVGLPADVSATPFVRYEDMGGCFESRITVWRYCDICDNCRDVEQVTHIDDLFSPEWYNVTYLGEVFDVSVPGATINLGMVYYDFREEVEPKLPNPLVRDNCKNITASEDKEPRVTCLGRKWTEEITWTMDSSDDCNSAAPNLVFILNVEDPTPPTFITYPEQIVEIPCAEWFSLPTVTIGEHIVASDGVTEVDGAEFELSANIWEPMTIVPDVHTCDYNRFVVRQWLAFDCTGNQATYQQTITMNDITAPIFEEVIDPNIESECEPPADPVLSHDNCPNYAQSTLHEPTQQWYLASDPKEGPDDHDYTVVRKWEIQDSCQNSNSQEQTVRVRDTIPPYFVTQAESDAIMCTDSLAFGSAAYGPEPTDKDDCSPTTVSLVEDPDMKYCQDGSNIWGTLLRTWTTQDTSGHTTTSETQTITIQGLNPGHILMFTMDGDQFPQFPKLDFGECKDVPPVPNVVAYHACTNLDMDVDLSITQTNTDTTQTGLTYYRNWYAVDSCGNAGHRSQTVTLVDTTPPSLQVIPSSSHIECTETIDITYLVHDKCNDLLDESDVVLADSTEIGDCPSTVTNKYIVTDASGHSATAYASYQVHDTIPPEFDCDGKCPVSELTTDSNFALYLENFVIEACHDVTISCFHVDTPGKCGSYTRKFTCEVRDQCGLTGQPLVRSFSVAPTYYTIPNKPGAGTCTCEDLSGCLAPTVLDNEGNSLNPDPASSVFPTCGSFTRSWQTPGYDSNPALNCGERHTQTVIVEDNTPPTLTDTTTDSFECDRVATPQFTVQDTCAGQVRVKDTQTSSDREHENDHNYDLTFTVTYEDECGNDATDTITVEIYDRTDPYFFNDTLCPDETVEVPRQVTYDDSMCHRGYDNCYFTRTVQTDRTELCNNGYIEVRTITIQDDGGATATETVTLSAADTTPPYFTLNGVEITVLHPVQVTPDKLYTIRPPDLKAYDGSNPQLELIYTMSEVAENIDASTNKITRSWRAVDGCGLAVLISQVIWVEHKVGPPDIWLECSDPATESINLDAAFLTADLQRSWGSGWTVTWSTQTVDTPPGWKDEPAPPVCDKNYDVVHTWEIKSEADPNTPATYIGRTVRVRDTVKPTWYFMVEDPAWWRLDGKCTPPPYADPRGYDCSSTTVTPTDHSPAPGQVWTSKRSWSLEDQCGNKADDVYQIVYLDDTQPPYWIVEYGEDAWMDCPSDVQLPIVFGKDNCADPTPVIEGPIGNCGAFSYQASLTDDAHLSVWTDITFYINNPIYQFVPTPDIYRSFEACGDIPPVDDLNWQDNCGNSGTVPGTVVGDLVGDLQNGWTTGDTAHYRWEYIDECNRTFDHDQFLFATDTTPPVIAAVDPMLFVCPDDRPRDLFEDSENVNVTDCSNTTLSVKYLSDHSCQNSMVLLTAADTAGNRKSITVTMTVNDIVPPVWTAATTADCDCGTYQQDPDSCVTPTATDCGKDIVDFTYTDANHPTDVLKKIRTYSFADECANPQTQDVVITLIDNVPPQLTCYTGKAIACTADDATYKLPSVLETCHLGNNQITVSVDDVHDGCTRTQTYTFGLEDAAGNPAVECSTIFTYEDTAQPFFTGDPPANDLDEKCALPSPPTRPADDVCNDVSVETIPGSNSTRRCLEWAQSTCRKWRYTNKWIATDGCSFTDIETQTVDVFDETDPTISVTQGSDGVCPEDVVNPTASASDNCRVKDEDTHSQNTPGSTVCHGTSVFTFTAWDMYANEAQNFAQVTWNDNVPPAFEWYDCESGEIVDAPASQEVYYCDEPSPPCFRAVENCLNRNAATHSSSTCDQPATDGTTFCDKRTHVHTVTDDCQNTRTFTHSYLRLPPYILAPQNDTHDCLVHIDTIAWSLSGEWDAVADHLDLQVAASQNCAGLVHQVSPDTSDPCDTVYHWRHSMYPYTQFQEHSIHFTDTNGPTVTITGADTGEYECQPPTPEVSFGDDCQDQITSLCLDGQAQHADCKDGYTTAEGVWPRVYEYTVVATDGCIEGRAERVWTVVDNTPPTINSTTDHDACDLGSAQDWVDEVKNSFDDNCKEDPLYWTGPDLHSRTSTDCSVTEVWVMNASDVAGNVGTAFITLSQNDNELPRWINAAEPTDITVECNDWNWGQVPTPFGADNCDDTTMHVVDHTDATIPDPLGDAKVYSIVRTFTIVDGCGQAGPNRDQTVHVEDNVPPTWDNELDDDEADCPYHYPPYSGTNPVTATDSCGIKTTTYEYIILPGSCPCDYSVVHQWSATDWGNNTIFTDQTISVSDYTPPVIHGLLKDQVVEWGTSFAGKLSRPTCEGGTVYATDASLSCQADSTSDECKAHSESVDLTYSDVYSEAYHEGGHEYTITRTFTATDECGNTGEVVQIITVEDNEPPECPPDETIYSECDAVPEPCHPDDTDVIVTFSEQMGWGGSVRSWNIDDGAGNSCSYHHTVILVDDTPPVLSRQPPHADHECDCEAQYVAPQVHAIDNCKDNIEVDLIEGSKVRRKTSDPPEILHRLVNRWSATDGSNKVSYQQTITVKDTQAPLFEHAHSSEFQDMNVECDSIPHDLDYSSYSNRELTANLNEAYDACDEFVSTSFSQSRDSEACKYTLTRTWASQDASGHSAKHVQLINVVDTTPPVLRNPKITCILPSGDKQWVELWVSELFPNIDDNCDPSTAIQLQHCNMTTADGGSLSSPFPRHCQYKPSRGKVYIKAGWSETATPNPAGQRYRIFGKLVDNCGNEAEVRKEFWLPAREADAQDLGIQCIYARWVDVP